MVWQSQVLIVALILGFCHANIRDTSLRVGAFNIESFGTKKSGEAHVMEALTEIVSRYDLLLIQEIRDKSNSAIHTLYQETNKVNTHDPFKMKLSERQGRSSHQEQYAYFYRPSKFEALVEFQWPDVEDRFERPPYIVRFQTNSPSALEFGFIGVHITPRNVTNELNALYDVYESMSKLWDLKDFIMGGDFNADSSYIRKKDWPDVLLKTDERFWWVIDDEENTTTAESQKAYDRLILAGTKLQSHYKIDSAKAYPFHQEMSLSFDADDVSDHLPVELELVV